MAVQTKSKSEDKGPKKKINWVQIGVIGFCVLLVLMCIVSFSGLPNALGNLINGGGMTSTGAVVPGNPVYVNCTMNIGGSPVTMGIMGLYAGSQTNKTQYINFPGYTYPFEIYAVEYNQISAGVVGLSLGKSRTVAGSGDTLITSISKENVEDVESAEVGDVLYLPINYADELGDTNSTAYRPAVITAINDADLIVQYGSDTIDIEMVDYLPTS
ncbi:MAG TPA: hypothetical protein O0X66_06135 [Methanocorpusculum sp.]|nr:hypothetical protein [Methanocorpusculum sp.]HJJ54061.1 hypothetical protein [Methanocorpusculum sp.]